MNHYVIDRTSTGSPQMQQAVDDLRAWAPSRWVQGADRRWRPARIGPNPPAISKTTMDTLIDRGLVEVTSRNSRGGAASIAMPEGASPICGMRRDGAA